MRHTGWVVSTCPVLTRQPRAVREGVEDMKYCNLVFVQHVGCIGRMWLFELPPGKGYEHRSDAAQHVMCDTKKGLRRGLIAGNSFIVPEDTAKTIAAGCGAYWPLARVVGDVKPVMRDEVHWFDGDPGLPF